MVALDYENYGGVEFWKCTWGAYGGIRVGLERGVDRSVAICFAPTVVCVFFSPPLSSLFPKKAQIFY